jgi:hypothetical protein
MTVSTQATRVAYAGDGGSVAFAVPFPFFDPADLEVIARETATGVETPRALGADYTVAGGNGATGTVTAAVAPPVGTEWVIRRRTGRVQGTDYVPHDPFPAESHERALDRLTLIAQELDEDSGRALKLPKGEAGAPATIPARPVRAGHLLGFDAGGAPIAVAGTAPGLLVSSFAETLLDDGDAASARATLGAGAGGAAVFQAPSAVAAHDAVHANGADIASAGTLNLDVATGDQVDVTGTATITAITLGAGRMRAVRFTGALVLTHGASLVLPGAANITTAAGDVAVFRGYAGGVVRCVHYQRQALAPLAHASQAEMEAASSSAAFATPANMKHHPGAAKAWVKFQGNNVVAIAASHNVSSVDDDGVGTYGINLTTPFSSGDYAAVGSCALSATSQTTIVLIGALNPGSIEISCRQHDHTLGDPFIVDVAAFGDQ